MTNAPNTPSSYQQVSQSWDMINAAQGPKEQKLCRKNSTTNAKKGNTSLVNQQELDFLILTKMGSLKPQSMMSSFASAIEVITR